MREEYLRRLEKHENIIQNINRIAQSVIEPETRACSHKNSIKNHSEHDDSKKNDIEFIITSENFSETF